MPTSAPTPDVVALARRLYQEKEPVTAILQQCGISLWVLYRCLDGSHADGSGVKPAPIPQRRAGVRMRQRMGSRAALIARMWRTAERQVEEIEDRLKAAGLDLPERESNARTLAIVAKTLRELSAVDEARQARIRKGTQHHDDDAPPRDIDELRRKLAEKLEAFVAQNADEVSGDAG
jgi:hypothetical protein